VKLQEAFIQLGGGTHLFVNVPRPGDSEVTFSVFLVKLPPVTSQFNHSMAETIPLAYLQFVMHYSVI